MVERGWLCKIHFIPFFFILAAPQFKILKRVWIPSAEIDNGETLKPPLNHWNGVTAGVTSQEKEAGIEADITDNDCV